MVAPRKGPWENAATTSLPLKKGWNRQDPQDYGVGEATIVLGSLLVHYAVLFDTDNTPWLCVSRYNLSMGVFLPDQNGVMNPIPITSLTRTPTNTYAVAAAEFNDLIHVFTGEFTLTTADGMAYTRLAPIASGLSSYNARDAIQFFPESGQPKVMVVFASPDEKAGWAGYVIWDGVASLPLAFSSVRTFSNHFVSTAVLTLGTSGGHLHESGLSIFGPGAKVPCIQMVDVEPISSVPEHPGLVYLHEYDIDADTMTYRGPDGYRYWDSTNQYEYGEIRRLRVFPWFITEYGPDGRPVLKQFIGINFYYCTDDWCTFHKWENYALRSDTMVPQNHDTVGDYGWQGTPSYTSAGTTDGTPEEMEARKKYWTLLGVILGPAPFATNGMADTQVKTFSNVIYGQSALDQIEHKNSWSDTVSVSSSSQIRVGIKKFGAEGGITGSLDVGYKHGWDGSRTTSEAKSVGIDFTAGATNESTGNWGTHGWAIFMTPTLVSQVHKIYAYDYDVQRQTGTYLNLDMPTVVEAVPPTPDSPPSISVNAYSFQIDDPGGSKDQSEIRGLLAGMRAFPQSTDLAGWKGMKWERDNAPWKVIFGTGPYGGATVPTVSQGTSTDFWFSDTTKDIETGGQTNSVSMKVGTAFNFGTKLNGFTETLTLGYDGSWSMQTATTTQFSSSIKISYHMPFMPSTCTTPSCVDSITVQPYLLQATDYTADWVPTAYALNLPWCITWRVNDFTYGDGHVGQSPLPESAEGTVVGGERTGSMYAKGSYSLEGGRMEWLKKDGTTTRIPISADTFEPRLGAAVLWNGLEFRAALAHGVWKRKGQIWQYAGKAAARTDAFTLTLDFESGEWSFEGNRLELADHLRAGEKTVRLELVVNGRYTFFCDIEHDVESEWEVTAPPPDDGRLGLTAYSGRFDSASGKGHVRLEGVLSFDLPGFGDVSMVLNGRKIDIPLLSLDRFWDAFENGLQVRYKRDGIRTVLDFGKKTWSAQIGKDEFDALFAPRWGGVRLRLLIGGAERYSKEHAVASFTTRLSFRK